MSGGRFDYRNDDACSEIFHGKLYPAYGDDGFKHSKEARRINPLEDRELSEMVFDMFCVLHSYDWYASGDTGEEQYRADVKRFKDKWMHRSAKDTVEAYKGDLTACFNELLAEIENRAKEELCL